MKQTRPARIPNGRGYSTSKRRWPDFPAQRKRKSGTKEMSHRALGTSIDTQGKGRRSTQTGPQ
eukprot:791461-Ditylum_brightwellii.AAC.1